MQLRLATNAWLSVPTILWKWIIILYKIDECGIYTHLAREVSASKLPEPNVTNDASIRAQAMFGVLTSSCHNIGL